jgi:hypothetical protein
MMAGSTSGFRQLDWKNSSEFFGKGVIPRGPHTEPRGRYANRRRQID